MLRGLWKLSLIHILAMNVPVGMPIGQLIIGDLVAIIVVKQLFGGIGMNLSLIHI